MGCGSDQTFLLKDTATLILKCLERNDNLSPPPGAEIKNAWIYAAQKMACLLT